MSPLSRREFIKTSIAVGTVSVGALPLHATAPTATDVVTLGKSGMSVTRLAFGTGSNNGYVQAALGQQEFTRWFATPTTAASASLRPLSPTRRPPCWARRSKACRATATT